MSDAIVLRSLRRADYPAIADMLRRMWYVEPTMSVPCARRLAMIDLHESLSGSTSAMVAQQGSEVIGIIATRIAAHEARRRAARFGWHRRSIIRLAAPLLLFAEGRRGLRDMRSLRGIDAKLLRNIESPFDAEVVLFLVDESHRGQGVGRLLFNQAMAGFLHAGVRRYYLFTDTRCNIGFYEHRGLTRLRGVRKALSGDTPETFCLYEGRL